MKILFKFTIFLFLALYIIIGVVFAASSVPHVVLNAMGSVVRIFANYNDSTSSGTGFIINNNMNRTFIATNLHVVEGNPNRISVWTDSNTEVTASILSRSTQYDLCILELDTPTSAPALVLNNGNVSQGDVVYAVGFPAAADDFSNIEIRSSGDATITNGIVSAIRNILLTEYGVDVKLLQINAAINPGNSGGPLFNNNGEVVGINTYGSVDSQGIFGAISVEYLIDLMAISGVVAQIKQPSTFNWLFLLYICGGVIIASAVTFIIIVRNKKKTIITILSCIGALVIASISIYSISYSKTVSYVENNDFHKAGQTLSISAITQFHDVDLNDYIKAGRLFENRRFAEAQAIFENLSVRNYRDSTTMSFISRLNNAKQYANVNNFDQAIDIYKEFEFFEFNELIELLFETRFRKAVYYIYELNNFSEAIEQLTALSQDGFLQVNEMINEAYYIWALNLIDDGMYAEAYNLFNSISDYLDAGIMSREVQYIWALSLLDADQIIEALEKFNSIKGYDDVNEIIQLLTEQIYKNGQNAYNNSMLEYARENFEAVSTYQDSKKYLKLIRGKTYVGTDRIETADLIRDLVDIFYFEDAADVLIHNPVIAQLFLVGSWKTHNGSHHFTISLDSNWNIQSSWYLPGNPSLPGQQTGFTIENGIYFVRINNETTIKPQFLFSLFSPDSMELYCFNDGRTHILYRNPQGIWER